MRLKIVLGLLVSMLVAYGVILATRTREPHDAPAAPSASAGPTGNVPVASGSASASAPAAADGGAPRLLERPLRVVGLGWDLIVPGVLANGGLEPSANAAFSKAGVDVRVASVDTMATVESALARGGADKDGADIALVPLPAFVASYERLRALSPEIFFVVGWSHGREALLAAKDVLTAPPPTGELKIAGTPGDSATFFGLFALEQAGVAPSSVKLAPPPVKPNEVALEPVDRGAAAEPADAAGRKVLCTTADASRLVPFVAIAQRGLLEKSGPALVAWARTWLDAQKQLEGDPPTAARAVATAQGAPEPLALLKRLGEVSSAPLGDNARVAGLSGRGAITLELLFQQAYRIWRASGVLATPAPEAAPVNTTVIASLVRADPTLAQPAAPTGKGGKPPGEKPKVLLVHREPDAKLDEPAFLADIGLLAGVFERAPLRITVKGAGPVDAAKVKKLIETAQGQFDLAPGRLTAGTKAVEGKSAAAIEVLDVP